MTIYEGMLHNTNMQERPAYCQPIIGGCSKTAKHRSPSLHRCVPIVLRKVTKSPANHHENPSS